MGIETLHELVVILTKLNKKKLIQFDRKGQIIGDQKGNDLLNGIRNSSIKDEREAVRTLYGVDNPKLHSFVKLKERTIETLSSSTLLIDEEQSSLIKNYPLVKAKIRGNRYRAIIKVLQILNASESMFHVSVRLLKLSQKFSMSYDSYISAFSISEYLQSKGILKEARKFRAISQKCLDAFYAEEKSRLLFDEAMSWYLANWSLQQEKLVQISNYLNQIKEWKEQYETHELTVTYLRFARVYAEVEQNYPAVIESSKAIQRYYEEHPHLRSNVTLTVFLNAEMSAYIWQGEYEKGYKVAQGYEKYMIVGTASWIDFKQSYLILTLRSNNYAESLRVFREVIVDKNFDKKNQLLVEKWRLLEFYVRFATKENFKESLLPKALLNNTSRYTHFRAFAKTLPQIKKDTDGFSVVAMFAYVLFLISIGDTAGLMKQDESLQSIRRKRLSKLNYRLAIFSRLINLLVVEQFDYERITKRAELLLQKLSDVPTKFAGGTAETLEIIPFEDLWKMMMEELQKQEEILKGNLLKQNAQG